MAESNQSPGSWTHYQKMVLSELERQDAKQDQFGTDLLNLRLLVERMAVEVKANTDTVKALTAQIKSNEETSARHQTDISLLKYKIGFISTTISTGITLLVQFGLKWMESS